MIKPRNISGFADYTEAQNVKLSNWIQIVAETYRRYGFSRLIPRPLELRSVLLSRGGIQKQIFGISRLQTDEATDLALPFDRTVPLANWVAKNASDIVFPYKRYDISYCFRGERAQAGRFQGFLQADIDIIGYKTLDLNADAECIAVLYEVLKQLKIGPFIICLNNLPLTKAILRESGLVEKDIKTALIIIDKLQKIGAQAAIDELKQSINIDSEQAAKLIELFGYQGSIEGFAQVCDLKNADIAEGINDLTTVWQSLLSLGVPVATLSFCPGNVRGLDYYSGTVFETFLIGFESVGSIASGGRFDDLVATFSPLQLPGVGGSIGLTRLFDTVCKNGLVDLTVRSESQVFVGFRTIELKAQAQQIAMELRQQGIRVDLFSGIGKAKNQFSYADKKGIPILVMAMDETSIIVKDMRSTAQIDLSDIAKAVDEAIRLLGGKKI